MSLYRNASAAIVEGGGSEMLDGMRVSYDYSTRSGCACSSAARSNACSHRPEADCETAPSPPDRCIELPGPWLCRENRSRGSLTRCTGSAR
jgi:hypothetical protein